MRVRPSLPLWTLLIALLATFSSSVWATESDVQGGSEQVFRAEELDQMLAPLALSVKQLFIASVLLAVSFPCVATFVVLWKELGAKDVVKATLAMIVVALVVGTLLNLVIVP